MENRNFVVSYEIRKQPKEEIAAIVREAFTTLGYKMLPSNDDNIVFEKGNKVLTYIGFTNWDYVYRTVEASIRDGRIILTYQFSWLTNIGVLVRSASPELKILQNKFDSKSAKVERFR